MIYFAHQITPLAGKRDALIETNSGIRKIFESHGAKTIGAFKVALGQDDGSLLYFSAYPSMTAASATWEALQKDSNWRALMKQSETMIASVNSGLLEPLPDSPLQ